MLGVVKVSAVNPSVKKSSVKRSILLLLLLLVIFAFLFIIAFLNERAGHQIFVMGCDCENYIVMLFSLFSILKVIIELLKY